MIFFNQKDLLKNIQNIELTIELLGVGNVFTEQEKKELLPIYKNQLSIYNDALQRLANKKSVSNFSVL